ncbi:hypothetical protein EGW08_015807 [Elysia chlorotica]|uniref:Uncharacterized protein n=1 Tax=Elysia chlorotica TaxID=188477 RepID=A0A3S1BB32_ELYCH|nr:hypothetical protein EGW08_015807 [Elysia chlorotica]
MGASINTELDATATAGDHFPVWRPPLRPGGTTPADDGRIKGDNVAPQEHVWPTLRLDQGRGVFKHAYPSDGQHRTFRTTLILLVTRQAHVHLGSTVDTDGVVTCATGLAGTRVGGQEESGQAPRQEDQDSLLSWRASLMSHIVPESGGHPDGEMVTIKTLLTALLKANSWSRRLPSGSAHRLLRVRNKLRRPELPDLTRGLGDVCGKESVGWSAHTVDASVRHRVNQHQLKKEAIIAASCPSGED